MRGTHYTITHHFGINLNCAYNVIEGIIMFDIERFSKGKCDGKHLITSCCNCGKIKDQLSGKWLKITPPNDVILSHSYCMPCVKQLYPEIYSDILQSVST